MKSNVIKNITKLYIFLAQSKIKIAKVEFLTTFFSPQTTAHPWYLNTDYRETGWKMKDTLVGFIKTQLELLEEDELITESWNSYHLYFTTFPDTSIRTTKNEVISGRN